MKKISYLCSTCLIFCATLAYANIFSPDTHLSVYTKSTTSVAESSDFIKLAAVYPLSGNGGMTFKAPKATSCAAGYESYNGKCIKKCDRKAYPFASQPSTVKGTFSSCTGLTTYYGYTACNNGWSLSNHDCIENTCDGYVPQADLSHCQTAGGNICYRGSTAVYKCSTCDAGWVLNASGVCVEKSCPSDEYPYPSNPGEDAGKVKSCQSGERTWYGYESCNNGWVKSGSYCNKVQCDTTTYPYTTQGQAAGCKSTQECKAGSDSYYGCGTSGCKSGYIADGKQCMLCSWDDNALDACPEHGVCTSKTCGGTTKYTLNSCEGGESTQLTCNVGDIYYSDDTCSSDVISGKTPIGVVYDTEHKLVVGLEEGNAMWGGYGTDVPDIANPSNVYAARDDLEGKSHTNVLVSLGGYPAAKYCYDMTTGGKEWYLPAFGELYKMYTANGSSEGYVMLNKVFNAIGGTPIDSDGYWTSTEVDWAGAGRLNPPAAYLYGGTIKTSESSVRCIFSYTEGTTTTYVKQNNTCVKDCSLDGYDLDSCPEHRICTSKTCGGITKYKSGECENGYTLENGTCNVCHAGDIYYSDDTCSSTIISCKTPIGVVYDVTNKLVVSLDESVRLQWGKEGVVDSPVPNDYDEAFYDEDGVYYRSHDFNGKSNTDILVASGIYPAAHYCHNMTTGGREWYLPALGEMWQMSTNITAIDNTLSTVGTKLIQSEEWDKDMYLSSSEYNDEYTWFFRLLQHFAPTVNKITPEYVRCIFTYKDSATTYVESDNTCSQNCSFDGYPLTECPRFARCRMKTCNGTRRFGVTECQPSFKLIGDTCERICPTTYLRGLISEDSIIYDDFLEHSVIMQASPSDSEMSGYVGDFYATRMYAENKQCDIEFIQERVSKLFPGAYIRIIAAEPATTHGSSGEICRHCSVHVEERRYDENGHMMYMNSRNQVF